MDMKEITTFILNSPESLPNIRKKRKRRKKLWVYKARNVVIRPDFYAYEDPSVLTPRQQTLWYKRKMEIEMNKLNKENNIRNEEKSKISNEGKSETSNEGRKKVNNKEKKKENTKIRNEGSKKENSKENKEKNISNKENSKGDSKGNNEENNNENNENNNVVKRVRKEKKKSNVNDVLEQSFISEDIYDSEVYINKCDIQDLSNIFDSDIKITNIDIDEVNTDDKLITDDNTISKDIKCFDSSVFSSENDIINSKPFINKIEKGILTIKCNIHDVINQNTINVTTDYKEDNEKLALNENNISTIEDITVKRQKNNYKVKAIKQSLTHAQKLKTNAEMRRKTQHRAFQKIEVLYIEDTIISHVHENVRDNYFTSTIQTIFKELKSHECENKEKLLTEAHKSMYANHLTDLSLDCANKFVSRLRKEKCCQ